MLMIRLARVGARKQPHYRVVVIEKAAARNGRSVEVVGTYNPRTEPATVNLKKDRIDYWVSKGAQYSDRMAKIVSKYEGPVAPAAAVAPAAVAAAPAPVATPEPAADATEASETAETAVV